jgi:predicted transposase/invertase (TIGR01784 family)
MSRVLISFDYALKRLLRDKVNYDVLEGFLSELLKYDVKVKNIIESESNKEVHDDKYNRVDIMIEDEKGEILSVELQFYAEIDYFHRMLFGTSKILTERIKQGQMYDVLPKVISINIIYFDLGRGRDYVYHSISAFNGLHIPDDKFQLSYSQCKKYGKECPEDIYPEYYILRIKEFDDKAKDKLDEWMYFFKHNSVKDEFTARGLDKVRQTLLYEDLSSDEKKEYDHILSIQQQNTNTLTTAKYEGVMETLKEYEPKLAREREEKEAALAREREKEAALARALARERETEAALARALAELAALKKNKQD